MIDWRAADLEAPPRDRVILVTSGLSWHRKDRIEPSRNTRRDVIPEKRVKTLVALGGVTLLSWRDPVFGMSGGRWVTLDNTLGPQDFRYWSEFNNPVDVATLPSGYSADVVPPDVETLPPII
jgi:hypothetical protein